jgi:hypothetical protein
MMQPLEHTLAHRRQHKGRHTKPLSEHTLVHKVLHMMQLVGHKPVHMQPVRNTMVHDRTNQQMHC